MDTSILELDHDVSCSTGDLLEVHGDDIAVDLKSLRYGGINITLTQKWGVFCYPATKQE